MRHLLAKLTPIVGGSLRSVLTMERLQAIQDCIHALAEGQNITTTGGLKRGFGVGGLRLDAKRPVLARGGGGGGPCPFGELVAIDDETEYTMGIRGGVVYAGDRNFNVPYQGLDLAVDGVWLFYLEIEVEANRDDDHEILLPEIKTSPEADPAAFWNYVAWTVGPPETQYPDNENPEVADGLGTIIIPIGKLTIQDGAARLEPVGCGNITIGHCAGILNHTRG